MHVPPSHSYLLKKFAHRNRSHLVTAAILFITLLAATVFSIRSAILAEESSKVASSASTLADDQRRIAENKTDEANRGKEEVSRQMSEAELAMGGLEPHPNCQEDERNFVVWEKIGDEWQIRARTSVPKNITFAGWNFNERLIAVVAEWACVRIYDSADFELVHEIASDRISTGTWHPTKNLLAYGNQVGECIILDADSFTEVARFNAHFGPTRHLAWSNNGKWLASCGADGAVKVWDPSDWSNVNTFHGHAGIVNGIAWHPNSERLVSVGNDGIAAIWSLENRPTHFDLKADPGREQNHFAWTENKLIRTVSQPSTVIDRDPWTGDIKRTINLPNFGNWKLLSQDIAFRIVVTGAERSTRVVSLGQPELMSSEVAFDATGGMTARPGGTAIAISPGEWSTPIQIDLKSSQQTILVATKYAQIHQMAWSPDLHTIALVGAGRENDNGSLRYAGWLDFVDTATGKETGRVRVGQDRMMAHAVAWSPDSRQIVAATNDGVCEVFDAKSTRRLVSQRIHRASVQSMSWHPDGSRIASGGDDRTVNVWNSETGDTLLRLPVNAEVVHIEWSKDGKLLAAKDLSGTIRIWDASRGYENIANSLVKRIRQQRLYNEAKRLFDSKQYKAVILLLDEALNIEADHVDALMLRAENHRMLGQYQRARTDYARLIELDPMNLDAWNNKGFVERLLGQNSDAIETLTSAIDASPPTSRTSRMNRAKAYLEIGQLSKALEDFRIVFDEFNSCEAGHVVASIQLALGDLESFNAVIRELLDRVSESTNDSEKRWVLWTCQAPQVAPEHLERSLRIAESFHKNHAQNPESGRWMGHTLYRMGRFNDALEFLSTSAEPIRNVLSAYCWYHMAMVQQKLGNHELAIEWLSKANAETEKELAPEKRPDWERRTALRNLREEATKIVTGANL